MKLGDKEFEFISSGIQVLTEGDTVTLNLIECKGLCDCHCFLNSMVAEFHRIIVEVTRYAHLFIQSTLSHTCRQYNYIVKDRNTSKQML